MAIDTPSEAVARALVAEPLSVNARVGTRVYAVAPDSTIEALRARGLQVTVLASPARDDRGGYRSSDQINAALLALAGPGVAAETLGHSVNGTAIIALRIGSGLRNVRYLGGHHGDELPAVEFVTDFASSLVTRLRSDAAFANSVSGLSIFIAPMINPDGVDSIVRYNASNVDLNRNYSYQFSAAEYLPGPYAFSEPESQAVATDNEYHRYSASLTYHTGAINIGYPWNYTTGPFTAEPALLAVASRYASIVGASDFTVVRGADWYITHGDTDDYSFGFFGGFDLTVELTGPIKSPPISELAGIEAPHTAAAYDWLNVAANSTVVQVADASDNSAVVAQVSGAGVATWSDPLSGTAQLQVPAGTTLTVEKTGYATQTFVSASSGAELVTLMPMGVPLALPEPRVFAASSALDFALPSAPASLTATRAGGQDIALSCRTGRCHADALLRRPGMYDLAGTDASGVTHSLRNALLLEEVDASDESTLSAATVIWFAPWGSGTRALTTAPIGLSGVFGWISDGHLYTQTLLTEAAAFAPVSAPRHHGCNSSGEPSLALVWSLMFLLRHSLGNSRSRVCGRDYSPGSP